MSLIANMSFESVGSSSPRVLFSCTRLSGGTKKGVLVPDKDGYYDHPLGALNIHNSGGAFYDYEQSKALFERSSAFMRKVQRGVIKAELEHPKQNPGEDTESFIARCMNIDGRNVVAHISDVWLDFDNFKDPSTGKKVIGIMGKVCPSGPHAHVLERSIKNPKENTCFSIRSFTEDTVVNGTVIKVLKTIITFDYVTEPGIIVAEKFFSPTLESLSIPINKNMIDKIYKTKVDKSFESSFMSKEELLNLLGLKEVKQLNISKW